MFLYVILLLSTRARVTGQLLPDAGVVTQEWLHMAGGRNKVEYRPGSHL